MERLAEDNYVQIAENAIKELVAPARRDKNGNPVGIVTTSKIRNLLAMTASIYNEVIVYQQDKLSPEIVGRIDYLKIRFVYEAGREPKVRDLITKANLLNYISQIGDSRQRYILFSRYMEALVAYRKFYGGKDE